MPLSPDWSLFFAAQLGALAALTGFIVVAISINLARILTYPHLPGRAGESLIGPVSAIVATSLVLIPEQPALLLGVEVAAVGAVALLAPIVFQARSWSARPGVTATERIIRAATSSAIGALIFIGGAVLAANARAGLYWIAAGDIISIIAVVMSAWVLLIEIMR